MPYGIQSDVGDLSLQTPAYKIRKFRYEEFMLRSPNLTICLGVYDIRLTEYCLGKSVKIYWFNQGCL